jgi:hypothetical protein
MSTQIADFQSQIKLNAAIHPADPNRATELVNIAALLNTDTTTHDVTIQTPPAGLQPGAPGNSRFVNDILLVVNAGRAGNLTALDMSNAITAELSQVLPPVNTSAPLASGTGAVGQTLSCTMGVWTYAPTAYAYQWRRGGSNIAGATSASYLLVAADSGANVSCAVTATNAAGSTLAVSNAIAVA